MNQQSSVLETLQIIQGSSRYNQWIFSRLERHLTGSVLDIGSGLGDIARQFTNSSVEKVTFSDYDPQMLAELKKIPITLKKYSIIPLDISSPHILNHPAAQFDTITCVNVLEHIKDDLTALQHMKHLLRKGGKIVILVPAVAAIYGSLDSLVGHYRRYSKKNLHTVFEKAGLTVTEEFYMNMLGVVSWFFAGRILQQKRFDQNTCRKLDRAVPLLRALERFGPPPVGQSLIMIGEVN